MIVTVFWGCKILTSQYAYEMSIRRVLPELGAELVDLKEAHCCGDIVKSVNAFAAKYMAARVLALAEGTGLENLLVPCNRCHFTLSETQYLLKDDARLREKISTLLKDEQLEYPRNVRIWHIIDFLYDL
ncbi:MAG: heterodisulfide reductase-related iron-sulfur binding cluster, partial [Candidatus Bathyarchaeia archaeon]